MSPRPTLFRAARIWGRERMLESGGILVVGGTVRAVLESRREVAEFTGEEVDRVDLGDVLVVPAFVDAHAHLELTGLAGVVGNAGTFSDWIRALIAARGRASLEELGRAARTGAQRLLATGTALVGDIDSSGATEDGTLGLALRVRRFREALDAGNPARAAAVMERVKRDVPWRDRFHEGLSPHAPYTVSIELWRDLGLLARERSWPVAIHFAETLEELDWLERRTGPMSAILSHSPCASGLDLIEGAGLLDARTLLVHGNHVTASERSRIAQSGAALVHCPGTHRFFGRASFDARAWLDAGVPLALGTDSMASNDDLDMGRELACFAAAQPTVTPLQALDCATRQGARALGFEGLAGVIAPGAFADFALFGGQRGGGRDSIAALVHGELELAGLWVAGAPVGPDGRRVIQNA